MASLINRPDLARAARLFSASCKASRDWDALVSRNLAQHGDHGSQISGICREHFPEDVKDELRALAAQVSGFSAQAYAARPPRVHFATMRALSRQVATAEGSGFYGPQP
jgi:hypothetical protein